MQESGIMVSFEDAKNEILNWVSGTLKVPADQIDVHKPLEALGLDSLDAVHMISTIEIQIGEEVPEEFVRRVTCLNDMFEMMRQKLSAAS
jgi:acyl carrier protein